MDEKDEPLPPWVQTDETAKFGFNLGDTVQIIAKDDGDPFGGQIQKVVAFTGADVIIRVSGPAGEADAELPFKPEELELLAKNPELN